MNDQGLKGCAARRFGKTRLLLAGLVAALAAPAALAAVTVDQSPLFVQQTLPPNIVLMLDDSGSMAWDVMPDYAYLSSTSSDGLDSSSVNGVYYNPNTTYSPPPTATGGSYDNATFTSAWIDGYKHSTGSVNLNSYDGSDDTSRSGHSSSDVTYSASFTVSDATQLSCSSGYFVNTSSSSNAGKCIKLSVQSSNSGQPKCPTGYSGGPYSINTVNVYCTKNSNGSGSTTTSLTCSSGYSVNNTWAATSPGLCVQQSVQSSNSGNPSCPSGSSRANSGTTSVTCQTSLSAFTYTIKNSDGTYTRHYVGDSGLCNTITGGQSSPQVSSSVCHDDDMPRQNVANWFSYYHTRILMAKSGLLSAFSDINSDYRIGFGSIDGNNNSGLPSDKDTYGSNSTQIAFVKPFGAGTSGTQKAAFWNWVDDETASNGTPLRNSLDAVGRYYQTSQPWSTMSSDPDPDSTDELACRQSFTILTTDGFWNGSTPSGIGDVDGSTGPTNNGSSSQTYAYSPALPFADGTSSTTTYTPSCSRNYSLNNVNGTWYCTRSGRTSQTPSCNSGDSLSADQSTCSHVTGTSYSNTLADVAMKYWESDLRSSTDNEVPTSTEDPAFWQHMTTFTLGLGFTPVNDKGTSSTSDDVQLPIDSIFNWAHGGAAIANFSWPQPSSDDLNNISDLAHAAVNGHGGFYSATSPDTFTGGLKDALKRASERNGTGASLAANSTKLETGTVTYQAFYRTAVWTGDLRAYTVDPDTGTIAEVDHPNWSAADQLPAAASRTIVTYNPDATGTKFLAFTSPSTLSSAEQTALGSDDTSRQHVIDYLRGSASLEAKNGGTYRNRSTALGDIVDSQPIYVGAPDSNLFYGKSFSGSTSYASFASSKASRTPTIWVAANDGMLHGINANTGAETYAYLPGAVIVGDTNDTTHASRLANLANTNYGTTTLPHQYFNDGELTVADVYLGSTSGWRTVLVGTTGRGPSKTIYALDVTNPASPSPLWERSAGDSGTNSSYIGQIVGKPVIAQTANGTWSVLVGNGYNSSANKAALLQFAVSDGTLAVHATNNTTDNGMASPAVWMANTTNGISTAAYAGDLSGNVWSFDLSTNNSSGTLLFTATNAAGHTQSITAGMLVGKDPKTGYLWLFFGTGRYLTQSELSVTDTQSWYGIIVQANDDAALVTHLTSESRSDALVQRSIIGEVGSTTTTNGDGTTTTTLAARAISTPSDAGMDGKSGWYIDLVSPTAGAQGERMVTPNQFQGTLLLGTTRVPESSDPCNPSGSGWIMAIDPFTGRGPGAVFFDVNGDSKFDSGDKITVGGVTYAAAGVGFSSVPNNPIFVGNTMEISFDNGGHKSVDTAGTVGLVQRLSWRELISE